MKWYQVIRQKTHAVSKLAVRTSKTLRGSGPTAAVRLLTSTTRELVGRWFGHGSSGDKSTFDVAHDVDTSGIVRIAGMEIDSPNYVYGVYYRPTPKSAFQALIQGLALNHEEFTFIDFGSGKGLMLLLASDFPFRKIVGVEFAADLSRIAAENIRRYRSPGQRCRQIESVCMDAAAYVLPPEKLVLYFYDPFEAPVMSAVVESIERSFQEHPRDLYIVYYRAVHRELFDRKPFLRVVRDEVLAGQAAVVWASSAPQK